MNRRILIVRLSAIGDVVMASGLIPALRARFPEAHIAWLAEPAVRDLLAANPRLDEVILWPRAEWQRLWRERRYGELVRAILSFVRELRARRFDLVLDLQGLLKSGLWAWLSGARQRIGIGSREGAQWLMTEVLPRHSADQRIGSEYRMLARELGAKDADFHMDLALADADRLAAVALLREVLNAGAAGAPSGFIAIAPFTTRPQKHWFEERWAELVSRLHATSGLPVLMLGGPSDREAAARIAAACVAAACITTAAPGLIDLTGRTRIAATAAIIGQARLLIGVDTGLTHMGIALSVPTIALFGSTRPYLDTASPTARVLYEPLACSPCRRHPTCGGSFDCMRAHTVDQVHAVALELMNAALMTAPAESRFTVQGEKANGHGEKHRPES